jgi:hypothetical protein
MQQRLHTIPRKLRPHPQEGPGPSSRHGGPCNRPSRDGGTRTPLETPEAHSPERPGTDLREEATPPLERRGKDAPENTEPADPKARRFRWEDPRAGPTRMQQRLHTIPRKLRRLRVEREVGSPREEERRDRPPRPSRPIAPRGARVIRGRGPGGTGPARLEHVRTGRRPASIQRPTPFRAVRGRAPAGRSRRARRAALSGEGRAPISRSTHARSVHAQRGSERSADERRQAGPTGLGRHAPRPCRKQQDVPDHAVHRHHAALVRKAPAGAPDALRSGREHSPETRAPPPKH